MMTKPASPDRPRQLAHRRCSTSEWADDKLSVARSRQVAGRAIASARRLLRDRRPLTLETPSWVSKWQASSELGEREGTCQ